MDFYAHFSNENNGPGMIDNLNYRIVELKEEGDQVWGLLKIEKPADDADLALEGALLELERKIAPYGMKKSEALNWMLGHPELDEFFARILEHKKRVMQ